MSDFILTRQTIRGGAYRGVLTTGARIKGEPVLEMRLLDQLLGAVSVTPDKAAKKTWAVEAPIPSAVISEGVQTILIRDSQSGETLDSFAIVAGTPLEDDLRGEITLLRAELDMLKKAFRRHCAETEG